MDVSDLRKGVKIKMDGAPHVVTHFDFMKPGKGQAVYRCKLKNMLTGNQFDKSWRSGDKMEKADLRSSVLIFSYKEDDQYVFMDPETYDQTYISEKVMGTQKNFLIDDAECEVLYFEDAPIEVALPNFVVKEITYTEPGARGDTATNVTKPAQIDTGYEVQVPLFINEGDLIKIDTRTGDYAERVKK
ncbi:MAG: elongation factor P [Lentisphaeraceae bacterium]|nr:elongation factor P [Lentisphaeraceae bacterium]